jgi:hypothetical protein
MTLQIKKLVETILQFFKSPKSLLSKRKVEVISTEQHNQSEEMTRTLVEKISPFEKEVLVKVLEEKPNLLPQFVQGDTNLADGENTKLVRKYINYEFGLNFEADCLQCVEYVQYRVKQKLGIWIDWPIKSGRDAKYWPVILGSRYKVSEVPIINSVASFDAPSLGVHGHVVFVENIFPNGEIEISEVNLPRDGIYNIKRMLPSMWRDRYSGKFISFF